MCAAKEGREMCNNYQESHEWGNIYKMLAFNTNLRNLNMWKASLFSEFRHDVLYINDMLCLP